MLNCGQINKLTQPPWTITDLRLLYPAAGQVSENYTYVKDSKKIEEKK
jgi:hypothetical protein